MFLIVLLIPSLLLSGSSQEFPKEAVVPTLEGFGVATVQGSREVLELGEAKLCQLTFLNLTNCVLPK